MFTTIWQMGLHEVSQWYPDVVCEGKLGFPATPLIVRTACASPNDIDASRGSNSAECKRL
jgi:hypothetical protein